jgi:hypothetical protein
MNSHKNLENQIINRVYGYGRVWAFSQKDFTRLGAPASIDRTLSRMAAKGVIRRVIRGVYDYPAYSPLLQQAISPDIDQVAHALARKFGWHIQVSANVALNIMGLSTQVPTQYCYLSDGPSKTYQVGSTAVQFTKTRLTQLGLKYAYSEILVQAIHALGVKPLRDEEQQKIRTYVLTASGMAANQSSNGAALPEVLIKRIVKDTQYVTSWISRNIRQALLP